MQDWYPFFIGLGLFVLQRWAWDGLNRWLASGRMLYGLAAEAASSIKAFEMLLADLAKARPVLEKVNRSNPDASALSAVPCGFVIHPPRWDLGALSQGLPLHSVHIAMQYVDNWNRAVGFEKVYSAAFQGALNSAQPAQWSEYVGQLEGCALALATVCYEAKIAACGVFRECLTRFEFRADNEFVARLSGGRWSSAHEVARTLEQYRRELATLTPAAPGAAP